MIINGELQNGIGGGVCQVSTTVFNAAYEAGLRIDRRTNHALYISHYPLGRDATVNYPDLDLRFTNDTENWLLLRTFVGSGSLTVNLYGTPVDRRVESETAPLVATGKVPVKKTDDPSLKRGERVVDEVGVPPRETSVHRTVYDADGTLLHDDVWRSYYVGEPSLVRVGTKKPAKKPAQVPSDDELGPPGTQVPAAPALPGQPATRSRRRLRRSDRRREPVRHARGRVRLAAHRGVVRVAGRDDARRRARCGTRSGSVRLGCRRT